MAERIMLNINHIAKTFNPGTITEKRALTDVDLKLNEGDFVTIIGGNGAGKSTTLNAVAGVFAVDQGTIEIAGVDVTRLPEYKRAKYLGRVFQDPMMGTAATMNIEENMALAMRRGEKRTLRWGISNMERDMYREQLRTLGLGLEERMSSKVGLLSGGQRQALTLLMAALRTPKLLLLDEHTAALDPKTAAKVLELTEKIVAEQKLTAMMVTHNMKDAIAMGNRLIMMNAGRIVVDVRGEEKKKLTREDLMQLFEKAAGQEIENDRKFHYLLVEASHNNLFFELMNAITDVYREWIDFVIRYASPEVKGALKKAHQEMFEAILTHDRQRCEAAIDRHYDIIERRIQEG